MPLFEPKLDKAGSSRTMRFMRQLGTRFSGTGVGLSMHLRVACIILGVGFGAAYCPADPQKHNPGIQARLNVFSRQVPLNHPVWARFSIENMTDEPVTLTVPNSEPDLPSPETGLPLSHVFSGTASASAAVSIVTESGQRWDEPVGYRKPSRAPLLLLAPRGTVGTTVDLRDHFPSLRGAGTFRVSWAPYGGSVRSENVQITIAPRKQVEFSTDEGKFVIRLAYDEAPLHVENFLELAKNGSYTGLSFHRIEPGYLVQGGCPRSDGTGIRLDGKRIPAEFNSLRHEKGSVSMALLGDDADSGSCQFFICNTRMKEWDGRYTVFGGLVGDESFQTLDRIMQVPADESGRPSRPIIFRAVRLIDEPVEHWSRAP